MSKDEQVQTGYCTGSALSKSGSDASPNELLTNTMILSFSRLKTHQKNTTPSYTETGETPVPSHTTTRPSHCPPA